jgi:DNA replication protein DnaC
MYDEIEKLIQTKETIEHLINFAKNPFGFLLMSGKQGRGKSYSAMAIYHAITPYRLPAYDHDLAFFINQADLNMEWNKYIKVYGHPGDLFDKIAKTKLFILDDLGTKMPTDSFMDFLYAIADKRNNLRKTHGTIITTNFTAKLLREKFGDSFFSRVASGVSLIFDHGSDRRLSKEEIYE